ncbi:JDVT-CTERM domain-containing protein, partial [Bathymodiolus thermophilus thioautotrophic gill symbiont]
DIDDTAPTNILLSNVNLIKDQPANTLVGTLSASDVDTNTPLTFAVNDTTNFKIVNGNELRTNKSITTALGNTININITASDNTNDSAPQPFTITITTIYIAAPVIDKFTVTQGENKGPLISKDGGEVTVSASAGTGSYTWSSNDFSNTSTSKAFVFNPQSANIGTRTITLKVTAGDFSSERVLKLKLVDTYPNGRTDTNGNGISDSKESGNSDNELPAGTNKKITSPENTRILPGIIGEDSGQLTLDQLKQYRVANHLSDYTKDTLATGDIYDYIIEGLSATGNSTQVIIALATPIPANAVLRQYSLATGWRNFVVGNNNIQSKANTSNTCDNTDGTWQTGLITGATCLKLTLKDGGENDADGNQANGVIESTVSIATPVVGGNDDSSSNSSSGGGCVYNPSAPARFDTVFILLMTLSAYYLIRRRRRFSH